MRDTFGGRTVLPGDACHTPGVNVPGVELVLRDLATLDDVGRCHAPPPVRPGDLVATHGAVYRIVNVLWTPPGALCVPVLVERARLVVASR